MSKITNDGIPRSGTGSLYLYTYGNSGRQRVNSPTHMAFMLYPDLFNIIDTNKCCQGKTQVIYIALTAKPSHTGH